MKNVWLAVLITVFLTGCATYKPSVPEGYSGATSTVKDSVKVYSSSKADFYYVTTVDGAEIENSRIKTIQVNQGRGMNMTPSVLERSVPARAITLGIVARTDYAAPILALTNTVFEVKGTVEFTPEPSKTYTVRGDLGETYSAVWIEDDESKALVGKKVEVNGPARLGFFEK